MTIQRITPVAVLLAAALAMGTEAARAQETVNMAVRHNTQISPSAAEQFIVTGAVVSTRTFTSWCMSNHVGISGERQGVKVVYIDRTVPPAAMVIPIAFFSEPVAPGTRLVNPSLAAICVEGGDTYDVHKVDITTPQNQQVALVTTPAGITLAEDHKAVVGAGTDELGIADAVCVKKGQKAIKTEIISDILLEAGDRLTDFLELDFNPATGETLYGAWLEY